eukprot:301072_1
MSPTLSPTYQECLELSYVMTLVNNGDVIIFETGVYDINYTINITGFKDIIFSGLVDTDKNITHSTLQINFHSHAIANKTAFFNIIDCHNITFEKLIFTGYNSSQYNKYKLNSLFNIQNSTNIKFKNVIFEQFNLTNNVNDSDINVDVNDMIDLFALINFNHEYNALQSYQTLDSSYIHLGDNVPDIPKTHCSYVIDKNGIDYCGYNSNCKNGEICLNITAEICLNIIDNTVAFVPNVCNIEWTQDTNVILSYKYECVNNGNESYGLNKTVYIGSNNCSVMSVAIVDVTWEYFNQSNENISFYCNDIQIDNPPNECVMNIKAYNSETKNDSCIRGNHLVYNHTIVPNECIIDFADSPSTGFVCVDDNTLFELFYSDTQCSQLINDLFNPTIGYAYADDRCFEPDDLYLDLSCPITNTYDTNNSYVMSCHGCEFRNNIINNGFLIKSIAFTSNESSELVTGVLIPVEIELINSTFINNSVTENGRLLYINNVIINIEGATFNNNKLIDRSTVFLEEYYLLQLVYTSNLLIYYFMNFYEYPYISRIAHSQFFEHSSGILYIDSIIDMDTLIYLQNNHFDNNVIIPASDYIIYFKTYNNGSYFDNLGMNYCQTRLCGVKLSVIDCNFTENTIAEHGAVLAVDIEHSFNISSSKFVEFLDSDDEISIKRSQFINNRANSSLSSYALFIGYQYNPKKTFDGSDFPGGWNILDISDTIFDGNNRGLIFAYNHKDHDKISYDSTAKYIKINNSQFINNQGTQGAAMTFNNLQYLFINIELSNISNNSGDTHGAVYIDCNDGTTIDIRDSEFMNNKVVSGHGGAMYINVRSSNNDTTESTTTFAPTRIPITSSPTIANINITSSPTNEPTTSNIPSARRRLAAIPTPLPTTSLASLPTLSPLPTPSPISYLGYYRKTFDLAAYKMNETLSFTINVNTNDSMLYNPEYYFYAGFDFIHGYCSNPLLTMDIEQIDQGDAQIRIFNSYPDTRIPTLCRAQYNGCGYWDNCFNNYPLNGIDSKSVNITIMYEEMLPGPKICTYAANMNVTITCVKSTSVPTSTPIQEPTNEPTITPTTSPSSAPTTLSPTSTPSSNPTHNPVTPSPTFGQDVSICPRMKIFSSTFSGNTANSYGGALYLQYDTNVECMDVLFDGAIFEGNKANRGGALFLTRIHSDGGMTQEMKNVSIVLSNLHITNNRANGTGGGIHFVDDGTLCKFISSNYAIISNSYITNNTVNYYGGGIFAKCVEMNIYGTSISNNMVKYIAGDYRTSCTGMDCLVKHAKDVDDAFGGGGAGIFSIDSSMTVMDSEFINNKINMGNGGALLSKLNRTNSYILDQNVKLILLRNTVKNNDIISSNVSKMMTTVDCKEYAGLIGFGAGFWIEISKQYSTNNILVEGNQFESNKALFVNDLYYNIYDRLSLHTVRSLISTNKTNVFITQNIGSSSTMAFNATSYGSSPVDFTNITIDDYHTDNYASDKQRCLKSKGCLGYILPGDNAFQATFKFIDIYGNYTSPLLACSHLTYNLSQDLDLEDIFIHLDDNDIRLSINVNKAEFDSVLYINMSDTHQVITDHKQGKNNSFSITNFVIATLCQQGQEVRLSEEGVSICTEHDMTGKSFRCGSTCSQSSYLFTRWEPVCHACPKDGVTCNGGNDVILDYAWWARVNNNSVYSGNEANNVRVCEIKFETYLCPAELCCNTIKGCSFDVYNRESLCAKNRDPDSKFCGRCMPGYSEVVGTYDCKKCDVDESWILILPILGGVLLLIYLFLRDPFTVTLLFTYVYKSLLYFYQIIPILTYQTNLGLLKHVSDFFNLSFLYSIFKTSNGTCLFGGMSALGKLYANFLAPTILLTELIILRAIPEIIKWCWSFDDNTKYRTVYQKSDDSIEIDDRHDSKEEDSMQSGLLDNDILHSSIHSTSSAKLSMSTVMRREIAKQASLNWAQKIRENFNQAATNAFLIVYIVLCNSCIKMFNCSKVDGKSWLWYAGENQCWDGGKNSAIQGIFLLLFLILCMFPFFMLYKLQKYRNNSRTRRKKYSAFVTSYRPRCWYYESVMMTRRIVLLLVYAFPKTQQLLLRAIIAIFCILILVIHVKVQPFLTPINNKLETILLFVLCMVSIFTLISSQSSSLSKPLSITISSLSALPLVPLPWLGWKYWKRRVAPKIRQTIALSSDMSISRNSNENIIYVPPKPQIGVDDDIGNITLANDNFL